MSTAEELEAFKAHHTAREQQARADGDAVDIDEELRARRAALPQAVDNAWLERIDWRLAEAAKNKAAAEGLARLVANREREQWHNRYQTHLLLERLEAPKEK